MGMKVRLGLLGSTARRRDLVWSESDREILMVASLWVSLTLLAIGLIRVGPFASFPGVMMRCFRDCRVTAPMRSDLEL
jgi:hypothetical protein